MYNFNPKSLLNLKSTLTHGHNRKGKRSPTYNTWLRMRERCLSPKSNRYYLYGARGTKACDRWVDSFENFLQDMGERPKGMTLDRINIDGNYEPGNCRWADRFTQSQNRRKKAA